MYPIIQTQEASNVDLACTHSTLICLEKADLAWTHEKYYDKILYISFINVVTTMIFCL
jgi:hypothetical protein